MKTLFTTFLLFLLSIGYSQNTFNIRPSFNEISTELLTNVIVTDSCYYAMGITSDTILPYLSSILFAKFDLEGNLEYDKVLASQERTYETWSNSLTSLNNNELVNVGYSFFLNGDAMKAFFIKMNTSGDTILTQDFINPLAPSEEFISPQAFAKTPDGGFVFSIYAGAPNVVSNGVIYQNIDMLVIKIDSVGNIQWQNTYGDNNWDLAMSLLVTNEGKIIIGGSKSNLNLVVENYLWQTYIIGLDNLGNEEWTYLSPPDVHRDGAKEMVMLEDGSLIVASGVGYEQDQASVNDMWFEKSVFKLNSNHELVWEKEFKDDVLTPNAGTYNIIAVSDGSGFIVTGTDVYNPPVSWIYQKQGWIMKMNGEGDTLWTRKYVYPVSQMNIHKIYDIKETTDGGFILCGESLDIEDDVEIPQQSWLLKLDEHGCLVPDCYTDIEELEKSQLPFKMTIYPNPTTDYLNIYQYFDPIIIPRESRYRIVDNQGRMVANFPLGESDVTMVIPVWGWTKGAYFVQLAVNEIVVKTEKFIVQ
ncbi:MAG: hypothetical protein ACI9LN_004769 [Saprospiraceae bacterium]|jgi:hypothetical protein